STGSRGNTHMATRDRFAAGAGMKALFLYSPVGGGHLHASRALAAAWRLCDERGAVEEIDYLDFLPRLERVLWTRLYLSAITHWPSLWRSYRRFTNHPLEPRFIRDRVRDVGSRKFCS